MKILIFTKNWLGDVIFETPALKAIRGNYPDAHIVCATTPRCEEILRKNIHVNEVVLFDEVSTHKTFGSRVRFVQWLRSQKFDKVFLFQRSFSRALMTFLGGVKERIGYDTKRRGFLLTRAVPDENRDKHHVHYFLNLLKKAGLKVEVDSWCEFYFSEEDDRHAANLLSDKGLNLSLLVALNPGGNRSNKRWPAHLFARLSDHLVERYGCSVLITGSSQDENLASDIIHGAKHSRPVSLCGSTHLGDLGAVFSRCRLVISGDSGPLHIAAGVGTNVLALFGPTDPRLTGPFGRGKNVVLEAEIKNEKAMASIEPSRVMEIIEKEKLL
jgi:lipopolysaccharide heptosyltransferase II